MESVSGMEPVAAGSEAILAGWAALYIGEYDGAVAVAVAVAEVEGGSFWGSCCDEWVVWGALGSSAPSLYE